MTSKRTTSFEMATTEAPAKKGGRKRATKVKEVPASAPFNPKVSMRWEGDAEPDWQGTLDALVRMNELDPAQDAEFIEEMRTVLREHGEYTGGGGAAPVYVLNVVEGAPDPQPEQARLRLVQDAQPAEGETEPEAVQKSKCRKRAQAPVPAADATPAPESTPKPTEPAEARGEGEPTRRRGRGRKRGDDRDEASVPSAGTAVVHLVPERPASDSTSVLTATPFRSDLAFGAVECGGLDRGRRGVERRRPVWCAGGGA